MEESEEELVARLRSRDPAAWQVFVSRYWRMVCNVGYRMTGNAADAQDVAQEALSAFVGAIDGFRAEASLSTYLYRIAVSQGSRAARERSRDRRTLRLLPLPQEGASGVEDPADRDALLGEVRQAVLELPAQRRAVLVLRHYEGKSVEETARILDLAPGTVKAHLHQAVAHLRQRLRRRLPAGTEGADVGEEGR